MITQEIAECIRRMKAFYRWEVIKTVTTDKIRSIACMCADRENNIYVSCRETKNVVVFDSELNEIRSFSVGITPISMALIENFLMIADFKEEKIGLFTCDGQHQWTQPSQALQPSLRMPTIGMCNDGTARLLDFANNTIYDLSITSGPTIRIQEICTIRDKHFYDQTTGVRSLCGIVKDRGKLYTFCGNALHSVDNNGALEEYVKIPVPLAKAAGMVFVDNFIFLLDNKNNSIVIGLVQDNKVKEFKTITFDKQEGILGRMCVTGNHLYFSRKKKKENTCIEKASL